MPYIKPSERVKLDDLIDSLTHILEDAEIGAYNYVITRIISSIAPINYFKINSVLGVLEAVKQEYYRRVASDYEDEKRATNGDVYNKNPFLKELLKETEEQNETI